MEREPRVFTVQIRVNRERATQPVEVMTEPAISDRPLTTLRSWVTNVRDQLADGDYTVVYAVDAGIEATGPDRRSGEALERVLAEPMSELTRDLRAAFDREISDEVLVELCAGLYARGLPSLVGNGDLDAIKPGFARTKVGCWHCEGMVYEFANEVAALARKELPAEEAALRDAHIRQVRDRFASEGITLPEDPDRVLFFFDNISCNNPFAKLANDKLQERLGRLAPDIERRAVAMVLDGLEQGTVRAGKLASALRRNFDLS